MGMGEATNEALWLHHILEVIQSKPLHIYCDSQSCMVVSRDQEIIIPWVF